MPNKDKLSDRTNGDLVVEFAALEQTNKGLRDLAGWIDTYGDEEIIKASKLLRMWINARSLDVLGEACKRPAK